MVRELIINNKTVYQCEACGLYYLDLETAKKCEEWCKKTRSCSIEITKKAIRPQNITKLCMSMW